MISLNMLLIITLIIISVLAILMIVFIIKSVKGHRKWFEISQCLFGIAVLSILFIGFENSITVGYEGGTEVGVIEELNLLDNKTVEVVMEDGGTYIANSKVYGEEYKYLSNCKIIKKTLIGLKVYDTANVLVVKPNIDDFDDKSMSEKQSIIKEMNKA